MSRKTLSVLIVLIMALAIVPVTSAPVSATSVSTISQTTQGGKLLPVDKQIEKLLNGNDKEVRLIIAPTKDKAMDVYNEIAKIGKIDPISRPQDCFIVATIPRENLEKLKSIEGIVGIWEDRMVKLPEPVKEPDQPAIIGSDVPKPDMFLSVYTTQAYDTWVDLGILGDNVTVAVLDTGVDVGHPFLQTTLDGRRKIIKVYDESDEGIADLYYSTNTTEDGYIVVNETVQVYWGVYSIYYGHQPFTEYNMTQYYVGDIQGDMYYVGLLPERYFDLNNFNGEPYDPYDLGLFGDLSDVYPVLVVEKNGTYTVYIDLNLDNDFTNDQPLTLYDETGAYIQVPTTKVDIALADVVPEYGYVVFMWDAHGHGTHVSGTIAGVGLPTDPVFNETYGMAPNAQLIELKVLPGELGFGRLSWIIYGMIDAVYMGADVISMSLGSSPIYNDGLENPEIFYVNLLTDWYGVTFVIAAGNEGPTTNTVGSPGDSDLAITVGAYRSSLRWQMFWGVDGVADTVASFSSRGPRMDGMLDPDVIAPGEDIFSSLPLWYTVMYDNPYRYYGIWSGTSMATPHVSGAVALLISYAKEYNLTYNPLMLRRALELSAKPVEGATMIDQGFGLIQVEDAINVLQNLSQEQTIYIYGGTTYTGFRDLLGKKKIPLSPAYVEFNSYFYAEFGLPYLYRGVYIRNERPAGVPLYFYPLVYYNDWGLWYTESEKAYRISTNVDWIIPNTDEVVAGGWGRGGVTIGSFSIQIDYSKLEPGKVYVGFVYIDDPDTEQIDGFIPVIIDMPLNPNGESEASLSDTALPGVAKHYFFQVAPGTKELRVTLRVPLDENGTPMGRTTLMIAKPNGEVVAAYVPNYWFVGPGLPEYTWVISDPEPGNWEITAYTSTFTKPRTGYDESHYQISVKAVSVTIQPEKIQVDRETGGVIHVPISVRNSNYGTFMAKVSGLGMGRLDVAYGMIRNVSQDEFDVIGYIPVTSSDYYLRVGITEPEDPYADLDLYVFYFKTYEDLMNFQNYVLYTDQIGPTSYEEFEKFLPEPGYYLIAVYGYDTAGYDPIHYLFYYQLLSDNGDVTATPSNLVVSNDQVTSTYLNIRAYDEGTYLGVVSVSDASTGEILDYAPVFVQVGMPRMTIIAYPETPITIGEPVKVRINLLDAVTMMPVYGESKVIINGQVYYTDNGVVEFYFTPKSLNDVLRVKVINPEYQDTEKTFTLSELDQGAEFRYYESLYQEEVATYNQLVQAVNSNLTDPYRTIALLVAGRYHNRAAYYAEKAYDELNSNPVRAAYLMKKAYLTEKRANRILSVFLDKFSTP
ncbi:S8 family serine peptidase [Thermococcus gammatolerans]|nr:S8 family serine peptidase [Thermococcus gammatolerans]